MGSLVKMPAKKGLPDLRGKIIKAPALKKWYPTIDNDKCVYSSKLLNEEDYAYTVEKQVEWTPYNSNLHMQGIKVIVKDPIPEAIKTNDAVEHTLLLLDMLKDIKKKENEEAKARMIREMAMAKKQKLEEKEKLRMGRNI